MTAQLPLIVIIEDETPIRRFLRASLPAKTIRLIEATNGSDGLRLIAHEHPDVVILDLGLPDMDGVQLIRQLREWSEVPVIVLSARDKEKDKVAALDAGADDYLVKPFSVAELEARLRVALRHGSRITSTSIDQTFQFGDIVVDLTAHNVKKNQQALHLTPIEFRLLAALLKNSGRVVTHRQLLRDVWGPSHIEQSHYLRIYMAQLRQKLEEEPTQPKYLLTELGVGYRFMQE